jgi:hypothetical protein
LALLNNPASVAKVAELYQAILAVYKADKSSGAACDLCGSTERCQVIEEFTDNPPCLCLRHRCGWRGVWVRHGSGDPKLFFAKWLAGQVMLEAKKYATQ